MSKIVKKLREKNNVSNIYHSYCVNTNICTQNIPSRTHRHIHTHMHKCL